MQAGCGPSGCQEPMAPTNLHWVEGQGTVTMDHRFVNQEDFDFIWLGLGSKSFKQHH